MYLAFVLDRNKLTYLLKNCTEINYDVEEKQKERIRHGVN